MARLARQSYLALRRRPLRTFLTALGTAVSATAFVSTIGLTGTIRYDVTDDFDRFRATEILVRPAQGIEGLQVIQESGLARVEALNGVVSVGRFATFGDHGIQGGVAAAAGAGTTSSTRVIGADAGALEVVEPQLLIGTPISQFHHDEGAPVMLMGFTMARRLGVHSPGTAVRLGSETFWVVGIFSDVNRRPESLAGVIVPYETASRVFSRPSEDMVIIEVEPGAGQVIGSQSLLALHPEAPQLLEAIVPPDPVVFRRSVEASVIQSAFLLSLMMVILGILSIMTAGWASVEQRRSEIGLRRAVGARPVHIFGQLIFETTLVGSLGGLLGSGAGIAITIVVSVRNAWQPVIDVRIALLIAIAGGLAGLVAGIAPAVRATRISPLDALRR